MRRLAAILLMLACPVACGAALPRSEPIDLARLYVQRAAVEIERQTDLYCYTHVAHPVNDPGGLFAGVSCFTYPLSKGE